MQYAVPDSDSSMVGTWLPSTGTDLYAVVDEGIDGSPPDTGDLYYIAGPADNDLVYHSLSDLFAPISGDITLKINARRVGADSPSLQYSLCIGTGGIPFAIATDTAVLTSSFTTFSFNLTAGQKAQIVSWSDLYVRVLVPSATVSTVQVTYICLETPRPAINLGVQFSDGTYTEIYTGGPAEVLASKQFKTWITLPTTAQNIAATCRSFCKVVNRESAFLYGFYTSGIDDDPGKMLFKRRDLADTTVTIKSTMDSWNYAWTPELAYSGGAGPFHTSSVDEEGSRLYRSKFEQPEAVPALSYDNVGRRDKAGLGLVALKEGLLIWKEDGVFSLSGQSDGNLGAYFLLEERDSTIRALAPNSLVLLDNAAWAVTTQGVYRLSSTGGGIASRSIEAEISRLGEFTNFSSLARAIAYESGRKLIIPVPDATADTRAKLLYIFDYLTAAWTTWDLDVSRGIVNPANDKLYLAHNVDKYILQERKTFTPDHADYKDWDITATATPVSQSLWPAGQTLVYVDRTYTTHYPEEGWLFTQHSVTSTVVASVNIGGGNQKLTLDGVRTDITAGACTLTKSYDLLVEYAPEDDKTSSVLKRFMSCVVIPEQDGVHLTLSFKSDLQTAFTAVDLFSSTRTRGTSSPSWGAAVDGDAAGKITAVRTMVPRNHVVARALGLRLSSKYAEEACDILEMALEYIPIGTRVQR